MERESTSITSSNGHADAKVESERAVALQSAPTRRIVSPRPLSTLSDALVRRLSPHPCAHCFRPEFVDSFLSLASRSPSRSASSARSGCVEDGAVTTVTALSGVVGWWVERIDFRTLTTRWAVKLRSSRPRPGTAKWGQEEEEECVMELLQEQGQAWYGSQSYCGAAEHERTARTAEPCFSLEPGEAIVRVEQFVTPRSQGERKSQQPRRAVVDGEDGIHVRDVAGWPGPLTGEVIDSGQEFDFVAVVEAEVDHWDGDTYRVPCFKLAHRVGWVPDFDPRRPSLRRVREIVSPVTAPPTKFSLREEVRTSLNKTFAPDLGASIHFTTSAGRCFSLVGRGNKESCFVVSLQHFKNHTTGPSSEAVNAGGVGGSRQVAAAAAAAPSTVPAGAGAKSSTVAVPGGEGDGSAPQHSESVVSQQQEQCQTPLLPPSLGFTVHSGSAGRSGDHPSGSGALTAGGGGGAPGRGGSGSGGGIGGGSGCRGVVVAAVKGSSAAAAAGLKPRCRITAVVPGGSGGPGYRISPAPRPPPPPPPPPPSAELGGTSSETLSSSSAASSSSSNNNSNCDRPLPSVLRVDSAADLIDALEQCARHGWDTAALCFAEYPFSKFEQKRLLLRAPPGCAVVGLRLVQGQLAELATAEELEQFPSPPYTCHTCGGSKARALAEWYQELLPSQPSRSTKKPTKDSYPPSSSSSLSSSPCLAFTSSLPPGPGRTKSGSKWKAQAARWYRLAAEEGDPHAAAELAALG